MFLKLRRQANTPELTAASPAKALTLWPFWACGGAVAVLLCVCALTMLIDFYRETRVKRALAEIQKAGGLYMRAEGGRSRPVIGIDLDATVVYDSHEVRTRGPVTDKTLLVIAEFDRLQELSLSGAQVTDSGLVSVQGLRGLRRLNLSGTRLTDAGLSNLKGLADLRIIDLRGTRVTASGVKELRRALPEAAILADAQDQ
jgi:hypothetical protein